MMSAKSTAASTPCRRTGWSVTSAQSSGVLGELEERVALTQRAVLGQGPAGLAHEPDRRALDGLTPQRTDEERLGHAPRLAPEMQAVPAHPVPAGPLAVRWLGYEVGALQAGVEGRARVELENAGSARLARRLRLVPLARRPRQPDPLGRAPDAAPPPPARRARERRGRSARADPAGSLPARVRSRARGPLLALRDRQRAARRGGRGRQARRIRPRRPPPARGRARRRTGTSSTRAAHEEGYAAVGGSLDAGRSRELAAYAPGRRPEPRASPSRSSARRSSHRSRRTATVAGLPAWRPETAEPWLYEPSIYDAGGSRARSTCDLGRRPALNTQRARGAQRDSTRLRRSTVHARPTHAAGCRRRAARAGPRSAGVIGFTQRRIVTTQSYCLTPPGRSSSR